MTREKWGLCRKSDNDRFLAKPMKLTSVLQVSLNEMYERAHYAIGSEYNPDKVIIFYAIEVGDNNMECFLHELTPDDCIIQTDAVPHNKGVTYNDHFPFRRRSPRAPSLFPLTVEFFVYVTKSFVGDVRVNLGG